jgi:hypothetical protein
MKKIPTIFMRDPENMSLVLPDPNLVCVWVFAGEGVARRKYDGTCVMVKYGKYFKRHTVKKGKEKPLHFIEVDFDPNTGKHFGWVPVENIKENKYHLEAFNRHLLWHDGTYELVGPKIQGNPENRHFHELIFHKTAERFPLVPRGYTALKTWIRRIDIEGLVFYHPDGRMAKIKKRDFGLKRVEK